MKEFDEIYNEIVNNYSNTLNESKKNIALKNFVVIVCLIVVATAISVISAGVLLPLGIIIFVISIVYSVKTKKAYKLKFKNIVISKLVKGISENLYYDPEGIISSDNYKKAGFLESFDNYSSDDLINGNYQDINVQIANLFIQKEHEDYNSSTGETDTYYTTVFSGLFAKATLNTNNNFDCLIMKNKSYNGKSSLTLDSNEFEKYFDVTTNNKIESLRLITSDVMTYLLDFKTTCNVTPEISIKGNTIYIRLAVGSVFEPKNMGNDLDRNSVLKNYNYINMILTLFVYFNDKLKELNK